MRARRLRRALAALLAVAGLFVPFIVGVPTAYDGEPVFVAIPVEHVNTLIGTGTGAAIVGEINNFPGASVPFGMVQYSPDTVDNYAGYDYDNPHSTGFSMTHASVGCPAFGDISMLPTTTPLGSQPWSAWEEIAHDDTEVGVPGYYTVRFPGTGVIAELTATTRTGVGRFRYPRNGWPALFHVRSGASLAGNYAATLQIEDNTTITGSATSGGFCGKKNLYTVYFAMKFSQPFSSYGTWDGYAVYPGSHSMNSSYSGGYVGFPAGSVLEVRTALSYVSVDGARANLDAEGGASFDDIRAATSSEWNAALSRIAVAGRGPGDVDTFYTCLYRSLLHPNTFNDVDGRYIGFDGVIHSVASGHTHYANFSDWDTYRSLAPLQGLLFPQRASDMIQSLVTDAEDGRPGPRAVRPDTWRCAGQRRPRRPVQLVCLGCPWPVSEHPGNHHPDREHTAFRSRRDRAPHRKVHSDHRAGRIRAEPPEVHRRPDHRPPTEQPDVSSGVDRAHRRRPDLLARRHTQQGLGNRGVCRAAVIRCGQLGGDGKYRPAHHRDRAGSDRDRDRRRATDDRRRRRLHCHPNVLRCWDCGGTVIRAIRR